MSKESAKAFVQAILDDEELRQRTEKMNPEDALPLGKEMGYDFTLEEFTDVMNEDRELDPEELGKAAGGTVSPNAVDWNRGIRKDREKIFCKGIANGTRHQFVETIDDEVVFGDYTYTYLVRTCVLCKYEIKQHIKFGAGGEIIYCN